MKITKNDTPGPKLTPHELGLEVTGTEKKREAGKK